MARNISSDDYFNLNVEFRVWLLERRSLNFEDLSSKEARSRFKSFCKRWNSHALPEKYYQGNLKFSEEDSLSRGRYKWKFKNVDPMELGTVRDNVETETMASRTRKKVAGPHAPVTVGPFKPPKRKDDNSDNEDTVYWEKVKDKRDRKRARDEQNILLDEMLPKATGRDVLQEKRRLRTEQRKDRELSPEPVDESTLMGSSGMDDYKRMIERRQKRRDERREKSEADLVQKQIAYETRERGVMSQFRQLVADQNHIVIPPREDPN